MSERLTRGTGARLTLVSAPEGRFEARLSLNGGAVSVVRRAAASPTRGDLAAPTLGAALGLCVRVAGALSLEMSGRYLVEWINLDGTRNARGNPNTEMGINYAF